MGFSCNVCLHLSHSISFVLCHFVQAYEAKSESSDSAGGGAGKDSAPSELVIQDLGLPLIELSQSVREADRSTWFRSSVEGAAGGAEPQNEQGDRMHASTNSGDSSSSSNNGISAGGRPIQSLAPSSSSSLASSSSSLSSSTTLSSSTSASIASSASPSSTSSASTAPEGGSTPAAAPPPLDAWGCRLLPRAAPTLSCRRFHQAQTFLKVPAFALGNVLGSPLGTRQRGAVAQLHLPDESLHSSNQAAEASLRRTGGTVASFSNPSFQIFSSAQRPSINLPKLIEELSSPLATPAASVRYLQVAFAEAIPAAALAHHYPASSFAAFRTVVLSRATHDLIVQCAHACFASIFGNLQTASAATSTSPSPSPFPVSSASSAGSTHASASALCQRATHMFQTLDHRLRRMKLKHYSIVVRPLLADCISSSVCSLLAAHLEEWFFTEAGEFTQRLVDHVVDVILDGAAVGLGGAVGTLKSAAQDHLGDLQHFTRRLVAMGLSSELHLPDPTSVNSSATLSGDAAESSLTSSLSSSASSSSSSSSSPSSTLSWVDPPLSRPKSLAQLLRSAESAVVHEADVDEAVKALPLERLHGLLSRVCVDVAERVRAWLPYTRELRGEEAGASIPSTATKATATTTATTTITTTPATLPSSDPTSLNPISTFSSPATSLVPSLMRSAVTSSSSSSSSLLARHLGLTDFQCPRLAKATPWNRLLRALMCDSIRRLLLSSSPFAYSASSGTHAHCPSAGEGHLSKAPPSFSYPSKHFIRPLAAAHSRNGDDSVAFRASRTGTGTATRSLDPGMYPLLALTSIQFGRGPSDHLIASGSSNSRNGNSGSRATSGRGSSLARSRHQSLDGGHQPPSSSSSSSPSARWDAESKQQANASTGRRSSLLTLAGKSDFSSLKTDSRKPASAKSAGGREGEDFAISRDDVATTNWKHNAASESLQALATLDPFARRRHVDTEARNDRTHGDYQGRIRAHESFSSSSSSSSSISAIRAGGGVFDAALLTGGLLAFRSATSKVGTKRVGSAATKNLR